jgi:hypothetical protein
MRYYEIRVFNPNGRTTLIYHQLHLDDQAAILAGKQIAGERQFDLWRGMDCVFAAPAKPQTMQ